MTVRLPGAHRVLVVSLVLVLCLLTVVIGLHFLRQRGKAARLESTLIDAAEGARSSGTSVQVDLATAAGFEWDQLYVIGPYTPAETTRDRVRVSLPTRRLHRIDARDDVVLLLFLHADELVADLPFPRRHADLLPLVRPASYDRGQAKIEFARRDGNAEHAADEVIARPLAAE